MLSELLTLLQLKESRDEAYKKKNDAAKAQALGDLTDFGSIIGGSLSTMSTLPGQSPNVGQGILGGALTGIGAGLPGMVAGGLFGGLRSARLAEDYEKGKNLSQELNMANKTVMPSQYMAEGGPVRYKDVQTEEGEVIVLPNGDIVDVLADNKHSEEDDDTVTDKLEEGSYVFSAKLKLNPEELSEEDNMIAVFPGTYSEQGNTPLQEMELTDIIGEEELTFAEAVKKIQKKITTLEDVKDIFTTHTNNMNVETRIPYLMRLMELQDRAKSKDYKVGESYDVTPEEAQALKEQGYELESE